MVTESNKLAPVSMPSGTGDDSEKIGLSFPRKLPTCMPVLEHYGIIYFKKTARLDQTKLGLCSFSATIQLHGQERGFPLYWTQLEPWTVFLAYRDMWSAGGYIFRKVWEQFYSRPDSNDV